MGHRQLGGGGGGAAPPRAGRLAPRAGGGGGAGGRVSQARPACSAARLLVARPRPPAVAVGDAVPLLCPTDTCTASLPPACTTAAAVRHPQPLRLDGHDFAAGQDQLLWWVSLRLGLGCAQGALHPYERVPCCAGCTRHQWLRGRTAGGGPQRQLWEGWASLSPCCPLWPCRAPQGGRDLAPDLLLAHCSTQVPTYPITAPSHHPSPGFRAARGRVPARGRDAERGVAGGRAQVRTRLYAG